MNRERTLASLSTITAVWETRNQDYLDNFVPFIATYATVNQIDMISRDDLEQLSDGLYNLFGIRIPILPLKAILKKAKKQRILMSSGGEYHINRSLAMEASIMGDIQDSERMYAQIVTDFQCFATQNYDIELSESVAEEILHEFVNSNDLEILSREHISHKGDIESHLPRRHRQYEYLVSAFYLNASQKNPIVFESMSQMAMGSILSATIFLPEIPDQSQTVKGVEFVLDTPLLLKLIGADGSAEQSVVQHLLKAISTQGGTLVTYRHIQQETLEILDSAKRWVESIEYDAAKANRTTIFFRQEEFKENDIVRLIGKIEDVYAGYNIKVQEVPDHNDTTNHQIDEEKLIKILEETIAERNMQFDAEQFKIRTQRDVESISAVYRMRGSHRPRQFRASKVILVTDNTALLLANMKLVETVHQDLSGFPACVTDQYVGTVLWINAPEAATVMHRSRLLASSNAALRPDASLEKAIVNEANRLRRQGEITSDDFVILTSDHLTKVLLAEKTLGDPEALDSPKVFQILNEVKARLLGAANSEIQQLNQDLESESQERLAVAIERDQTKSAVIGYAEKKAKKLATTGKYGYWFGVWVLILSPILPAFLFHPFISGAVPVMAVLHNIVGRFGINGEAVYRGIYKRVRAKKLRAIGVSDSAAVFDN